MKYLTWILLLCSGFTATAQNYQPDDNGSKVGFSIKNVGISTGGTFSGLKGLIIFDPGNIAAASFNVSVDANTVDTDIKARDNHLRKEEYLFTEKYPVLSIESTKIANGSAPGQFVLQGILTIKGTKKEISLPFTAMPKGDGYLFSGMFKINRRDFKVGGGSFVLSDNLNVNLSVLAKKS